jgi:hypothetical protein
MWRIMLIFGVLLSALLLPSQVALACQSGCNGGVGSDTNPNIFSPEVQPKSGPGVLSARIEYKVQFDIGQNISLVEIASMGSNNWTPLVDNTQTGLHTRSGRIAHIHQDIFDDIYTFDIRINSAVIWHNIEVKNDRLIVLGYNNGPIVADIIDRNRNIRQVPDIICPLNLIRTYSPQVPIKNSQSIYSDRINYSLKFDIGQEVSMVEIAPVGSTNWVPLVDHVQTDIFRQGRRIASIQQDLYDHVSTFDFRINGTVVWHNVEVKNERLIVFGYNSLLGYNKEPIIVNMIDPYRVVCLVNA